ncbi:hypothetical protein [Microbacterium sp. BK668]|uniref:hypothetical protein n=1 Tax=Microbacterium sp. BK668 TaxID=2512118 RepID=UPI001414DE56|nr:hypothetical protein [Microbacterium sp. BK668]
MRNGTIDGNGANVGFAFANRTAARFESVVLRRGRALLSWTDYSDANVFLQCHNRAGGPANSVLVEQVSSGDGLLMQSCKADAAVGLARLKYCRGAEIVGTVTGRIELDACSAIQIRGGHQEAPIINQTMVDIRSSDVVIDTTALYLTRGQAGDALPPVVRIADSGSPASSVVIRDSIEMRALVRSDEQLGSLVAIERAVPGTRLEARGLTAVVSVRDIGGLWSRSVGPSIGGASAVTSAVSRSLATVASGDFKLQDPGTGWVLSPTTAPVSATAATPSLWSLSTVEEIQGTLPAKGHRYRCQGRLAGGGYTPASAFTSWVTPTRGALRFLLAANGAVQEMRIWRFVGTSATANAYVAVPAAALTHTLYDTGANVNGFGWKPGSTVPPPG